jgi:hypothetical protein
MRGTRGEMYVNNSSTVDNCLFYVYRFIQLEKHLVAEPDRFFGQEGNDPFCAAIESRGNALDQWSDLCDFHDDLNTLPAHTNARNVKSEWGPGKTRTDAGVESV